MPRVCLAACGNGFARGGAVQTECTCDGLHAIAATDVGQLVGFVSLGWHDEVAQCWNALLDPRFMPSRIRLKSAAV